MLTFDHQNRWLKNFEVFIRLFKKTRISDPKSQRLMLKFANILSLYVVQATNLLVPLITIPLLTGALGVSGFGQISIVTSIISYFVVLTDWSFNLTGTQQISFHRNENEVKRQVFWNIQCAKCLFLIVSLLILIALCHLIDNLSGIRWLLVIGSLQIIGSALSIGWFLQGMERMVAYSTVAIIIKWISVPATYFFVQHPSDIKNAMIIQSLSVLVPSIISLFLIKTEIYIYKPYISFRGIGKQIREGFDLFLSQAGILLYSQTNVLILGALSGPHAAGIFNAADKIRRAAQAAIGPLSVGMFPRVNWLISQRSDDVKGLIINSMIFQIIIGVSVSIFLFVFSSQIIAIILGEEFRESESILRIIALLPVVIAVSNSLGNLFLIPFGYKRAFTKIILSCGIFNLMILYLLVINFGVKGAAFSLVLTELAVSALMIWFFRSKSTMLFRKNKDFGM